MSAEKNIQLVQQNLRRVRRGALPHPRAPVEDVDWVSTRRPRRGPLARHRKRKSLCGRLLPEPGSRGHLPRFEPSGFIALGRFVVCQVSFDTVMTKNGRKADPERPPSLHHQGRPDHTLAWDPTRGQAFRWPC